jgi:oxazoline/thiazoline dehydrogenase
VLLARALWAGALTERPAGGDGAALSWSHEDLIFHRASRRHADHRPRGKRAARPAWAEAVPGVALSAPLGGQLRQRLQSLSFEAVLATRRSVRGPLPPATLDELRDLLQVVQAERGSSAASPCRSYPTAGGLQSLDFHLVTAVGPGTAATLYRFDAVAGLLQAVLAPAGSAQRLLDEAAQAWGETHGTPCALVVVAARLPELAARYEATAYRLALLEAGGAALLLAQVATALGLGSCVLGNGDSALFAWASGLPEWQSPAIAEIAIAGRLPDQR